MPANNQGKKDHATVITEDGSTIKNRKFVKNLLTEVAKEITTISCQNLLVNKNVHNLIGKKVSFVTFV